MKKITLFFALILFSQTNAQVLSQNFDTALTWTNTTTAGVASTTGWSRVTAGSTPTCAPYSGAGMAKFASYDINAGTAYILTSPSFSLVSTNSYKVKFSMYRDGGYPTDADNVNVRIHNAATGTATAGTSLGVVNRSMSLAPTVSAEGWYTYQFNIPAGTGGTRYIRLVGTSQYGNNIYLDNISVEQLVSNDLGLDSVTNAPIFLGGSSVNVTGTIKNNGSNTITSAVINYSVDGGTTYSQNLTGLNIAPNGSYNYTHSTPWNPAPGTYSLRVWVSNPNGVADNNTTDNELIKTIRVASNTTSRKPLYEKFTSSTCGPCASFNSNAFSPFYSSSSANMNLINYQVNWPGSGDPYYTAETGVRRTYYAVSAAPTLFVDAKDSPSGTTAALQSELTTATAKPGYFAVTATHNLVGNTMNVNVNTTPYLTGNFILHVAVVEKTTTGNVASNGETSFKNVMMKMMPNASGTTLNCVIDTPIATSLSVDLSSTFKEADFATDYEVIAFIQDPTTKEIMNSYKATLLSNDSFNGVAKINVYPNPSNGVFTIGTELATDVKVLDIAGKQVYSASNVNNQTTLNLTNLQKGVYMLKMSNENGEQTEKIIIK